MRHARRGFTLLEMLVVIGIIMLLVAIVVIGFRHVGAAASSRETKADLRVCRGMLTEYENHNGSSPLEQFYSGNPAVLQISDVTGDVSQTGASNYPRYACNAVLDTKKAMALLMQVPANRTLVQSLSTKRVLEPAGSTNATNIAAGVVLLDGWSNPIIYVPAGGMHVYIYNNTTKANDTYLVRSTGVVKTTGDPALTGAERPFFASAGEDGDFTKGEDNVYSFQD